MLAFACAFTMFAGAAFTDQADIKVDSDVVDTLVSLGVIEGFEDGSFQPNGTVTRAQMAKMIYVLRTGNSDASAYNDDYTTFTDINGHWARGYIKYCQSLGIIAGKSATVFAPNASVTAQEAAKMLLVTLGYDATKAGLTGAGWASRTNALADENGLLEDVNTSFTAACPRQYAAQLIYNTIFANTVSLRDGEYTKYGYNNSKNPTVGAKYMGLEEFTGLFQGDNKINTSLKDGEIYVGGHIATYTPADGNALVGEMVKVLYKDSKDGVDGTLDKKDTVYGIYATDDTTTIEATLGDIDDNDGAKIKVDGTKYDVYSNGMDVYVNYVPTNSSMTAASFTSTYKKDSADSVKFVENENGKVIAAYITHVNFYKVTGVTSSKISIAGIGTLDIDDDMDLEDGVKKDDIVAVTTLYNADPKDDDAFNIIDKAEVVSGVKVAATKKSTEVRINDSYAKLADYNNKISASDSNYKITVDLDSTYDFVMYGEYWVAAKKVSASSQDIALVTKTNSGIDDQVKVLKADGSETVYTYDDDDNKGADFTYLKDQANDTNAADRLYSFSMVGSNKIQLKNGTMSGNSQNGGETVSGLTFKATATFGNAANDPVVYNEDNKSLYVDGKSYVAAEDAIAFVYVTNDDNYVYKIDGLKKILKSNVTASTTIEYVLNDDNEVVAFFINLGNKPGATASDDKYGYVVSDVSSSKVDGTEYREADVWNGTAVETIKIETSSTPTNLKKGAFIKYAVDADGLTDTADLKVLTDGNVAAVDNYNATRGLLTVYSGAVASAADNKSTTANTSTDTYKLSKDLVIIGVNTDDKESVEGVESVTKAFVDDNGLATNNIVFVLNSDDEVVAIFVDPDNAIINDSVLPNGNAFQAD